MICLILIATCCFLAHCNESDLTPAPVWLELSSGWESAPSEAESDERIARARLVQVTSDGRFAMIVCMLRELKGVVAISRGDGVSVFVGKRLGGKDGRTVEYQLAYESIQPIGGGHYPGSRVEEAMRVEGDQLILGNHNFARTRNLEEQFNRVIAWVNSLNDQK